MTRLLRAVGLEPWEWKTCWRSTDFWVALVVLLIPFGFLLLLVRWHPARRARRPR